MKILVCRLENTALTSFFIAFFHKGVEFRIWRENRKIVDCVERQAHCDYNMEYIVSMGFLFLRGNGDDRPILKAGA